MEITEVRIKLMEDNNERLQAFCSVTFDGQFVVRDLKIIEGTKGSFVAMPSRKLTDRCRGCGYKNHLRAHFCNQCGTRLDQDRAIRDVDGRAKLHADIAHPINSACRERVQGAIIAAYQDELARSKMPGYRCTYDDYDSDYVFEDYAAPREAASREAVAAGAATANAARPLPSRQPIGGPGGRYATNPYGDGFGRKAG